MFKTIDERSLESLRREAQIHEKDNFHWKRGGGAFKRNYRFGREFYAFCRIFEKWFLSENVIPRQYVKNEKTKILRKYLLKIAKILQNKQ